MAGRPNGTSGGVADGSPVLLRRSGPISVTGSAAAGTRLYLNNLGAFDTTPGTIVREIGVSLYTSGGQMTVLFDGTVVPATLEVTQLRAGNVVSALLGTITSAATQLRANGTAMWEVATSGAWQAVGGKRNVKNLADPAADRDAIPRVWANKEYAHGLLVFGIGTCPANTASNFLLPGYDPGTADTDEVFIPMPEAVVLTGFFAYAAGGAPVGDDTTFTVRVNGSDTALTAPMAAGTTTANIASGSVNVPLGDRVSIKAVSGAGISAGPKRVVLALRYSMEAP